MTAGPDRDCKLDIEEIQIPPGPPIDGSAALPSAGTDPPSARRDLDQADGQPVPVRQIMSVLAGRGATDR